MAILGNGDDNVLLGTSGNDTILAGAGNDTVLAGAGDDRVSGGEGNDIISGGEGNDVLSGGDGNDLLIGGAGNDMLIGGEGRDSMRGGEGADTFIFTAADNLSLGVGERDIVLDFEVGVDKIGLRALNLTAADIDLSHWFGGTSADGSYAQLLRISTNHDGVFDLEIQLNATHGLATLADLYI